MTAHKDQLDLLPVLNQADQWLRRLIGQASLDALWIGVAIFLAWILAQLTVWTPSRIFGGLERLSPLELLIATIVGVYLAFYSYRYTKSKLTSKYIAWKDSVLELKKRESGFTAGETETYRSTLETTLRLIDEMARWSEETVRYRISATINYGFVAYLLCQDILVITLTLTNENLVLLSVPISMAIGALTWLMTRRRRLSEAKLKSKRILQWHSLIESQREDLLKTL
jgi:hypothetical protein